MSHIENPLDTDAYKKLRLEWVKEHNNKLFNKFEYIANLDEKFFYKTSRSNNITILPRGEVEYEDARKLKKIYNVAPFPR